MCNPNSCNSSQINCTNSYLIWISLKLNQSRTTLSTWTHFSRGFTPLIIYNYRLYKKIKFQICNLINSNCNQCLKSHCNKNFRTRSQLCWSRLIHKSTPSLKILKSLCNNKHPSWIYGLIIPCHRKWLILLCKINQIRLIHICQFKAMLLFHNLWVASEVCKLSRVPATLHWALKLSNAPTQIRRRTPRICATLAIIREASQKWQVPVLIPTSLIILMGFVKTATWPNITSRERRSNKRRRLNSKLPSLERVEPF